MTVDRDGVAHCDECPEELETGEQGFNGQRAALEAAGWRTFKGPDGKWAHACPSCVQDFARRKR